MNQEKLTEFLNLVTDMEVNKLVETYIKFRTAKSAKKKEWDAEESQFNQIMSHCEAMMLKRADEQGVDGFKTPMGTTYTAETSKISIADDAAFFDFVKELGDLDFFERRVSSTHVADYMREHEGVAPPGLNIHRERVMRVRKASEK